MTDITSLLNEALKKYSVSSISRGKHRSHNVDEFLKEAYRINSHISSLYTYLRSIRQAYLSTSAPPRRTQLARSNSTKALNATEKERRYLTDAQRDEIDVESKQLLREINGAIRNLADAEQIRQNTEAMLSRKKLARNQFGVLGRWAAGGSQEKSEEEQLQEARTRTVKMHRESVIWFLRRKLEECGELQRGMMETRLIREMEKSKSILYKTQGANGVPIQRSKGDISKIDALVGGNANGGFGESLGQRTVQLDEEEKKRIEEQLSPEQLQLFAQENQDMLKHYEDTLDQVRTAERSLVEISELQTTLVSNLATQSEYIDQLVADSFQTAENVGSGNKQLKKAGERKSTAKYVFYGTVGFCSFLIIWDLLI